MSAMVGTLPDAYPSELLSLTDHLPVSTIDEVYRTIEKDSGRPMSVQHEGVDRIFLEDVGTLSAVASQVAFWSPDLDFRKFAEEWGDSLPHELDFAQERRALERAGRVLREARNEVIVPTVDSEFFGPHFLVMEYIEAGPIMDLGDPDFCARNGVDKHAVLGTLLDAFGIMAFKDGMFHADPHAGNVRLKLQKNATGGARPVLLDWGLFREITDDERMGLAKVFHSLANFDIVGLFDVLESLGFLVLFKVFFCCFVVVVICCLFVFIF
ncbi:unnamed protein product [Polarella glacialis]|uniref:ABC1 atypical kinase-like domain-containing protein n=1 Tax=Polarella glacialis TaxID=89957 RepID=A0A813KWL6_POLGL|nr:unnamed protein product [Polarella glacialis]